MQRQTLAVLLFVLVAIGAAATGSAFLSTLSPSAGSDAALPRVETSNIPREGYMYVPDIYESGGMKAEVLLVRNASGQLKAWHIPIKDGVRRLPDGHWWKPGLPCKDLRPDFKAGQIACFDPELAEWAKERHRWSLEGKRLSNQGEDMLPIPGVEEAGHFVFHKRAA